MRGSSERRITVQRLLIIFGLVLVGLGFFWPLVQKTGLGRLPGDIVYERGGFRFYFPLASSLLVSALLTLILWLFRR